MTKLIRRMVVGSAIVGGGLVSAPAWGDGLAGLEGKLSGTGRVGTFVPESAMRIAPATDGAPAGTARDARAAAARSDEHVATAASGAVITGSNDEEIRGTERPVASCRIEVARRRRVPPAKVSADTVVLRFTIEKSGRVHDAEALTAVGTDLEVAACAKRVVSEWVFTKRTQGAVVERPYRFSDAQAGGVAHAAPVAGD